MTEVDVMVSLGALALGSRLKRLSDQLLQDGIKVYRDSDIAFEPRWFPLFHYLRTIGPTSVMDVARGLGVSHPSINQIAKEMVAASLVASYKDARDKRRRVLALTALGKGMVKDLEPIWRNIRNTLQQLLDESGLELLGEITNLERALATKGFHQRFLDLRANASVEGVSIVDYHPDFQSAFARLNEQWISLHFTLEDADRTALQEPQAHIIDKGGEIIFARDDISGELLGTCALVMHGPERGELAKMAVTPQARGRGIGDLLGESVVSRARQRGVKTLFLETNSTLVPALGLYRKLGFSQLPFPHTSDYRRANVYMEWQGWPDGERPHR